MREERIQAERTNSEATADNAAKIRIIVMMITSFLYANNFVTFVVGGVWAASTFTDLPPTTDACIVNAFRPNVISTCRAGPKSWNVSIVKDQWLNN